MKNTWMKKIQLALNHWVQNEGLDREWVREYMLSKEHSGEKDIASLPVEVFALMLESMPIDMRLACLGDLLQPLGIELRRQEPATTTSQRWMDEVRFAYTSMLEVMDTPELDIALEALEDAIEAKREARWKLEMALTKVQDVREATRLS